MLGKGDVGRVYLVREKKTDKLYAMKGKCTNSDFLSTLVLALSFPCPDTNPRIVAPCGIIDAKLT